jgi:hypothetical protein
VTVGLDHILLGAPDLDAGAAAFAALTGVVPATGGSHPGFGTRNKLASLGSGMFFEVIAPDPAQLPDPSQSQGTEGAGMARATAIAAMRHPALLTFAIQTTDIAAMVAAAATAGLVTTARVKMSRTRPDGVRLDWTVVHFAHPEFAAPADAAVIPFAIDWQGSPHPSTTTPEGCRLRGLVALHPAPGRLAALYRALGLEVAVQGSLRPGLVVTLDTPNGEVCLLGD